MSHWSCVTPGWRLTCRCCMWCYHGNVLYRCSNLWTSYAPWLVFHAQLWRRESFFKDSSLSFSWFRWRISKFSWRIWSRLSWRFVGISKRGHVGGLFDVVASSIKHIFLLPSWRRVLPVNTSAWLTCTQRLGTSIYSRFRKSLFLPATSPPWFHIFFYRHFSVSLTCQHVFSCETSLLQPLFHR